MSWQKEKEILKIKLEEKIKSADELSRMRFFQIPTFYLELKRNGFPVKLEHYHYFQSQEDLFLGNSSKIIGYGVYYGGCRENSKYKSTKFYKVITIEEGFVRQDVLDILDKIYTTEEERLNFINEFPSPEFWKYKDDEIIAAEGYLFDDIKFDTRHSPILEKSI